MSNESSKALKRLQIDPLWARVQRAPKPYIDIGAGGDPIPGAEGYDMQQGNANYIDNRPDGAYGLVWSSHCLEHMVFPLDAFGRWWQLVAPGGWLWVIVPDVVLYEHSQFPSKFSSDHKWMFSVNRPVMHPRHINLTDLIKLCPGGELMRLALVDTNYDWTKGPDVDQSAGDSDVEVACEIVVWKR